MRPIKLTVRAFGPYAGEQVFDFAALAGRSFFLIHGPTGAGKTSILDAICFALYGRASGAREPRQMRSDHARPDCLTEVTFDFSIGGERYRIRRQPEQERPRKKGAGTTTEKPSATLWKRTAANGDGEGDGTVLEDGWARVDERVERLLGFKVDQFRQVVMLPQGMFQKLLMANSADREKILEALFAVEQYGRIEEALKAATAQMRREREATAGLVAETLRGAGAEGKEQLVARRAEVAGLRVAAMVEREGLGVGRKIAAEALAGARAVAEKLAERDAAAAEVRKLEGRREEFALKQARHERACKAGALAQQEEELRRRKNEWDRALAKLEASKKTHEAARVADHLAAKALEAETAREGEREAARARVVTLEGLAERVKELAGAAGGMDAARKALAAATAARAEAERSVAAAKLAVEAAEKRRAELDAVYAGREAIEARHNRTAIELNTRRALEVQRKARAEAVARVGRMREELPKAAQTLAWAKGTLDDLQGRWNRGQAAMLAASLRPGEACPVCGSAAHPSPAHSAEDLPSEEQIQVAREQVERLTKEHTARAAELAANEGELRGIESQVAQLEEGLGLRIGAGVEVLEAELKELEAKRRQAEDAGLELQKATQGVERAKAQEATAAGRMAAAEQAVSAAGAAASAASAVLNERQAAVPEELRPAGALERAREAAVKARKALEDALAAARKAAEMASNDLARGKAEFEAARELEGATKELFTLLQKEFGERARQAGFEDHKAFKAARMSDEEIAALDGEIRSFHVAVLEAKNRAERAATAAAGAPAMPDVAGLAAADGAAQAALEAKVGEIAELGQRLANVDAALARLGELEAALAALDAQYRVVGAIADAANGKNDYNMTFQRYVLGVFLDEVLYAATQRLRTMSKGRFLLGRVTETASGNRAGGLDLQVHDTHTSTVRPVSTLSGGESFLASLSLALGLADVVQGYAGGIRLETIFIDEGFGTLDPESLDLAIRALRDLQKGGRLVGIISHVTELREWIDARLEVTAGRAGSAARFVVA